MVVPIATIKAAKVRQERVDVYAALTVCGNLSLIGGTFVGL